MLIDEGLYYAAAPCWRPMFWALWPWASASVMMVSTDWTADIPLYRFCRWVICTPVLIVFAILIPYICFKNLEKQSIVERLRATD